MYNIDKPTSKKYYIFTDTVNTSVIHFGEIETNNCCITNLNTQEIFSSTQEQDWLDRLVVLGVMESGQDPYDPNGENV
jgi:hypothetical protein